MHPGERGFTIIEVLIAGAIVVLLALTGLATCKAVAATTLAAFTAGRDANAIETQSAAFRADAASALGVWVRNPGEVNFYARSADGRDLLWRYTFAPATAVLQRVDFDADGTSGVRDPLSGRIDARATYPPLRGITAFRARTITADRLGDPAQNVYGAIGTLFAHVPGSHAVSFERRGFAAPGVSGGNAIVEIVLANHAAIRRVHLLAGSLPTGFTITGVPRWHAIIYRVDQAHRFWFGFAGKSHVFINAHIDVAYGDWAMRKTWCDYNLLGNPNGLDPSDPHANYTPNEEFERSDALLARCRKLHPTPPAHDKPGNAPEPGTVTASPLAIPTPPPCWSHPGPRGRCWPADAPGDWVPAGPLPVDAPPRAWCATRAESAACSPPSASAR